MENQQPRSYEERVRLLCINAKFGDGTYCGKGAANNGSNNGIEFRSTCLELLNVKYGICPEIFLSEPKFLDMSKYASRYANAKPLYRLASKALPEIKAYKIRAKHDFITDLRLEDFGLWFLDDGCSIERKDVVDPKYQGKYTRSFLYLGNTCDTEAHQHAFEERVRFLFGGGRGGTIGTIKRHVPFTSDNNKVWVIPTAISKQIKLEAVRYGVLMHKFPCGQGSETIRNGVGANGL